MIGKSIGARLTAWYVAVLAIATFALTGASWWLAGQSVVRAADISLEARIDGVRDFLDNPRTRLTVEGLQDEFGEYSELTRGEALLEVVDVSGAVLCRPTVRGWAEFADREARNASSEQVRPTDRLLGGLPFRTASARIRAVGGTYLVIVAAPMAPAYAGLNRFHRWLLLLLPAILAIAGAGGYWVSRRALSPVDRITRAVNAITVQSLDRRLDLPVADDELRRLAATFNDVLARLQSAVSDIVRFTAEASHELRTPVSLIRTTAELALRHERTPEEYRAALADVVDQSRHISALVDDLLVLARTDAGLEPDATTGFDLGDVVTDAARDMTEPSAGRSVRVDISLPAERVRVKGDLLSIRRLLRILLDNAVKYSLKDGTVHLRVVESQRHHDARPGATIEITDDGIGFESADAHRLFERFYRSARARQHAPDGTGLGLAIAQAIVTRHDGAIGLSSRRGLDGSEAGCRVEVWLPLDCSASSKPSSV